MKTVGSETAVPSLIKTLNGEVVRPLPIWLMRQAGRYLPEYRSLRANVGSFWRLCMTPELAAEVTLQPIERFDFDAAIVFSDILTIPAALGQDVKIEDGIGPRLAVFPGIAGVARIPERAAMLESVYETLSLVRAKLAPEKALIGFAGAPWTLATYMLGENGSPEERQERVRSKAGTAELSALMQCLTDAVANHLSAQIHAGADVVQIFDSWAGGLSDEEFAEWITIPTRAIVSAIRRRTPDAHIIGFPRGATLAQYTAYGRDTGVDGVSIDTMVPIGWAVTEMAEVACQGNLDPKILVAGRPALDEAVEKIIAATRGRPFIFNLGHGVLPETPLAHVEHLVTRVRALSAP